MMPMDLAVPLPSSHPATQSAIAIPTTPHVNIIRLFIDFFFFVLDRIFKIARIVFKHVGQEMQENCWVVENCI